MPGVQSSWKMKPANHVLHPLEPLCASQLAHVGAGDRSGRTNHPPDRGVQQRRSRNCIYVCRDTRCLINPGKL